MNEKKRVGIVLDSKAIHQWSIDLLKLLSTSDNIAQINVYFFSPEHIAATPIIKSAEPEIVTKLYLWFDGLISRRYQKPVKTGFGQAMQRIKELEGPFCFRDRLYDSTDELLLWLADPHDITDDLPAFEFGVWFTKYTFSSYVQPYLLETVLSKKDMFTFFLRARQEKTIELYNSNFRIDDLSYTKTLARYQENLMHIIFSTVEEVLASGMLRPVNSKSGGENNNKPTRVNSFKGVKNFIRIFSHMVTVILTKIRNQFFKEQWFLVMAFLHANKTYTKKQYIPPLDEFWADPFIYERDETNYLFFEAYEESKAKGNISYVTISNNGVLTSAPKIIIEEPYHLSYPFIFDYEGTLFMIPESSDNLSIDLYQATGFPDKWEKVRTLLKGFAALDTTLLYHKDTWWLFTNMKRSPGSSSDMDLYLFYASHPLTENWTPHPGNPVVTDIMGSRPAGKIFKQGDKLYRPSQDCTKRYGYGVILNQIITLSKSDYSEQQQERIIPENQGIIALHTFNSTDSKRIIAFDAMKRIFKFGPKHKKGIYVTKLSKEMNQLFERFEKYL